MVQVLVGGLTTTYAATDSDRPALGQRYYDEVNKKEYVFVKNEGAQTISEKECAYLSDFDEHEVTIAATLAMDAPICVRPADGADIPQNSFGWMQIRGNATCIFGDSAQATQANHGIVVDDDTDGGKVGGVDDDITSTVNETTVEATTNSIMGVFAISQGVVNTTDADVEVNLLGKGW